MIFERFLRFMESAGAAERAAATRALTKVMRETPLSDDDREAAEVALTTVLDDASPIVRRALAEGIATEEAVPRHVVLSLAADQPEIAATVLARSPLLLDTELVDAVASGCERVQIAVAERRPLDTGVAAAIAEVGSGGACAALLGNDRAEVAVFSLSRMVERHGEDAVVRDLLLARDDLPVALRQRLLADLSNVLGAFVADRGWLRPERARDVTREALDRATLILAETRDTREVCDLVTALAGSGQLNAVLILRALCSGNVIFLEEALVLLTKLPRARVVGLVHDRGAQGLSALYARAGLPKAIFPAFQAALEIAAETETSDRPGGQYHRARQILERVLTRTRDLDGPDTDHLLMLLRRFAAEAAREEARARAAAFASRAQGLLPMPAETRAA
jgi:uncharacterized protein (DUF2336 family)